MQWLRDITVDDLPAALDRLPDDELRRRVRHVVTENDRVEPTVELLRAGAVADIGDLLTASHASLRDDYEVSCRRTRSRRATPPWPPARSAPG